MRFFELTGYVTVTGQGCIVCWVFNEFLFYLFFLAMVDSVLGMVLWSLVLILLLVHTRKTLLACVYAWNGISTLNLLINR